jgi:hypothetical protein
MAAIIKMATTNSLGADEWSFSADEWSFIAAGVGKIGLPRELRNTMQSI